jgi:hypothetical protein
MTIERCIREDFSVFLSSWNATQNMETPPIHFRMANWLQKCWETGERRLLLQAFRASGKSTITGLFTAWCLLIRPDLRILVLSAESHLAEKMVRTIRKVIEKHPLTIPIRPDRSEQWAADSFTVRRKNISRDPSVLARGLYANITGIRADIIICDDVEVPNTCGSAEKREKLRERLSENDFILTPGGMQLYIGTPHSYYSIYANKPRKEIGETEIFLKNFHRMKIPIYNKRGKSNWPERYGEKEIEAIRIASGPMRFSSQMMLEPVNILEGRLDVSLLRRYDMELDYKEAQRAPLLFMGDRKLMSCSAWWDPSYGKEKSDGSVVAIVFTDEDGNQYLHHISYIKVNPQGTEDEAGLQCRVVCDLAHRFFLPCITLETNGIGKFLPAILRRELAEKKISCSVQTKESRKNKDLRILEAFDVALAAKKLHVHESVYKTPFIQEMAEWRPGLSGAKDDGLDAAAGALASEPVRISYTKPMTGRLWTAQGSAFTATTDFEI